MNSTQLSDAPVSTTQRVVLDLRQKIIQGKFAPGQKLKVEALKGMLNSGASPIREALSLLTSDQLVERMDQRGFRVAPASATHFREILDLRCQLDNLALRASIESGSEEWEENLVLSHHRLTKSYRVDKHKRTTNVGAIEHWEALHKAFHMALLNGCGSPILLRFCDQLYDLNVRYRYLAGMSNRYEQRDVECEHTAIVTAALRKDVSAASDALIKHYQLTGEFLADQFD